MTIHLLVFGALLVTLAACGASGTAWEAAVREAPKPDAIPGLTTGGLLFLRRACIGSVIPECGDIRPLSLGMTWL